MKHYCPGDLVNAFYRLEIEEYKWAGRRDGGRGGESVPKEARKEALAAIRDVRYWSLKCGIDKVAPVATAAETVLQGFPKGSSVDISTIESEIRHVRVALLTELRFHSFVRVDHLEFLDQEALFGEGVADAFPSAVTDIREAGNCLAVDCNTPAVFHLMRAVEWSLRAICVHLGMKQARTVKKGGKRRYTSINYLEWEKMLDALHDRVDDKMGRLSRGKRKQELQEFYYPVLQDIRGIRDAWRNHVMHTRAEYTKEDAHAIFSHVKRLMTQLSTRVTEV